MSAQGRRPTCASLLILHTRALPAAVQDGGPAGVPTTAQLHHPCLEQGGAPEDKGGGNAAATKHRVQVCIRQPRLRPQPLPQGLDATCAGITQSVLRADTQYTPSLSRPERLHACLPAMFCGLWRRPPAALKTFKSLSAQTQGHVLLLEYLEERPLMLLQTGMGMRLTTYYRCGCQVLSLSLSLTHSLSLCPSLTRLALS